MRFASRRERKDVYAIRGAPRAPGLVNIAVSDRVFTKAGRLEAARLYVAREFRGDREGRARAMNTLRRHIEQT